MDAWHRGADEWEKKVRRIIIFVGCGFMGRNLTKQVDMCEVWKFDCEDGQYGLVIVNLKINEWEGLHLGCTIANSVFLIEHRMGSNFNVHWIRRSTKCDLCLIFDPIRQVTRMICASVRVDSASGSYSTTRWSYRSTSLNSNTSTRFGFHIEIRFFSETNFTNARFQDSKLTLILVLANLLYK